MDAVARVDIAAQVGVSHVGPEGVYAYSGPFPSRNRGARCGVPRILHLVWVGGSVPAFVHDYVGKWREILGDLWSVHLWTDSDLTHTFFGAEVIERVRAARNPAQKADIIKYHVVRDEGGFYVDADCEPVQSLDPIRESFAHFGGFGCHERTYEASFPYLSCGFFGAERGHPWIAEACRLVMTAALNTIDQHLTTGPGCLGRALQAVEKDSPVVVLPTSYVYPTGEKDPDTSVYHHDGSEVLMVHRWLHTWADAQHLPSYEGSSTYRRLTRGAYRYCGPFPRDLKPDHERPTTRILPLLHLIWVGGDVPSYVTAAVADWRRLLSERWTIRVWIDSDLTEQQFSVDVLAKVNEAPNGAQKADILKYHIIRDHGGFYVDSDCLPIRSLDPLLDQFELAGALGCHECDDIDPLSPSISCGFFGAVANHPWLVETCRQVMNANLSSRDQHLTTGPSCFGRALYHYTSVEPDPVIIMPRSYAYPTYERAANVDNFRQPDAEVFMYHQWFGSWVEARAKEPILPPPWSRLQSMHAPQWLQRTVVRRDLVGRSREDVFSDVCRGKRVLHVGCMDHPFTNLSANLHVTLASVCRSLDGFDVNAGSFPAMIEHLKAQGKTTELFSSFEPLFERQYDVVLVPEVLEHVDNVATVLGELSRLTTAEFILTVPDAHQCFYRHFDALPESDEVVEAVNPDHNCWFSPFTFRNTIRKYTSWKIDGVWSFNEISLLIRARPT